VARIDEARASLRLARSFQLPTVDAYLDVARSQRSDATEPRFPGPLITNNYGAA